MEKMSKRKIPHVKQTQKRPRKRKEKREVKRGRLERGREKRRASGTSGSGGKDQKLNSASLCQ